MKKVLFVAGLCLALSIPVTAQAAAETKEVCVDKMKDGKPVKDKAGKVQQTCKKVKVHQKLEGTKVPDKK